MRQTESLYNLTVSSRRFVHHSISDYRSISQKSCGLLYILSLRDANNDMSGICIWAASWQNQQCGCAPSEDSDQPGHPPSLIRVFAVRSMDSRVQAFFMRTAKTLIKLGGRPCWSESSLGAHSLCWFCHEAAHIYMRTMHIFNNRVSVAISTA